ncbi:MAG: recombination mediator RecR [Candidatus Ancaeobacter aquaticus]|nr:recombination mediator RecR [Candidatus Ancaeobacter aquaticus]
MIYPESITKLIEEFGKLPGIGNRTAERLALFINDTSKEQAERLSDAITDVKEKICQCSQCNNISEVDPCMICTDPVRDKEKLCVVEDTKDIIALERTRSFAGVYHVLMGKISPLKGIGPEHIKIDQLVCRINSTKPREVIIATGADIEGEATALYLAKVLKNNSNDLIVSRIAYGLPVGGSLEFANDITITRAMEGRKELS